MAKWTQPIMVKHRIGSKFGEVDQWHKPPGHRGTDYNWFPKGTKAVAVSDGKIVMNKWSDGLGWVVVLQVGIYFFGYCHMDKQSPLKVGAQVKAGEPIGICGNTGKFSAGLHLHFTLGKTKDAVFYGKVYDAHAFIEKMIARVKAAPKKAVAPVAAAPAAAAPVVAPKAPVAPVAPVVGAPAKLAKPALKGELKTGSKGIQVKYLQQQLGLPVDGVFGKTTHNAVVAFQKKRKEITKPDGIVGQLTWKAIN